MARAKSRSEVEDLRGTIRNMKKQISHLKKENARLMKVLSGYDDSSDDIEEAETDLEIIPRCPSCQKVEEYREVKLAGRVLKSCSNCGYKGSQKI